MNYRDEMEIMSHYGIGVALLSAEMTIIEINEAGVSLLHGEGDMKGVSLIELAPELCEEDDSGRYAQVFFGEYLKTIYDADTLQRDLPPSTRLVCFRNATTEATGDMMRDIINHASENIALYDAKGRLSMLSDTAIRMEGLIPEKVIGSYVEDIYTASDKTRLTVPQIIASKKAMTNYRQYYTTPGGVTLDIVTNSYPVVQNGQLLGVYCMMDDMSTADTLHKQIVELQEKLLEMNGKKKRTSKNSVSAHYRFKDIVYSSAAIKKLVEQSRRIARNDSNVLIYGETGTGKELFAQSIHNASKRAKETFLAINCAAIPNTLLESMLFGTEKGAYTGAEKRPGYFELADGGTLMLDEINSMDVALQSKLLRVLQEGIVTRVGGTEEISVDVRVISAINEPPLEAVEAGKLRMDLYYRLGVVGINIPPLRDRKEDIPLLCKHFIVSCNEKMDRTVRNVSKETERIFEGYDWPGNIRELQHALEHAMNILPDDIAIILPEYLPENIIRKSKREMAETAAAENKETDSDLSLKLGNKSLNAIKQSVEREAVCRTLIECDGNITQAARILKMSRQNLQYRIKRYHIDVKALLNA